jgi:hypothetical protein
VAEAKGIAFRNLAKPLADRIPAVAGVTAGFVRAGGRQARNILRLASNVADTETVVIGADTYEIETVATAIGAGATASGGQLNNTIDPVGVTITAHGLAVGDPVACQSEIMTVLAVVDANTVVLARGRFGTTIATHADGQTINKGNGITAGRIPVGFIATFTPAVAGPALAAAINNAKTADGQRPTGKVSTIFPLFQAVSLASGAEVLVSRLSGAVDATACSETLAGANNAWDNAAMHDGVAVGDARSYFAALTPSAQEVTLGNIRIPLPFTPSYIAVDVRIASTGVSKAWNGGFLFAAGVLTIDNTGTTDWAATDVVYVTARE